MLPPAKFKPVTPSGPISRKILKAIDQAARPDAHSERRIVRRQIARDLRGAEKPASPKKVDPALDLYHRGIKIIACLTGSLYRLEEFRPFLALQQEAESVFSPDGPPATPITESFHCMWGWCDAWLGPRRETPGTVILDLVRALGLDPVLAGVVENLVRSRMGIFEVEKVDKKLTHLRELVTNERHRCLVPAGYAGLPGEIWFARAVPPPTSKFDYGIVLTTPYVLTTPDLDEWEKYLQRTARKVKAPKGMDCHAALMKYGVDRSYWFNFIEDAYVTNRKEVLFLAGTPEAPAGVPWVGTPSSW